MLRARTLIAGLLVTAACGDDGTGPFPDLVRLRIEVGQSVLYALRDTTRLTVKGVSRTGGILGTIEPDWMTRDLTVVVVAEGLVTAIGQGETYVVASQRVGDTVVVDSIKLTVAQRAQTLFIEPATATLTAVGDSIIFRPLAYDSNGYAMLAPVFWAIPDALVAGIHAGTGRALARGNGTATVRATLHGVVAEAELIVEQVPVSFGVEPDTTYLAEGDSVRILYEALDRNGNAIAGFPLSWSLSDSTRAVVNAQGVVRPLPGAAGSEIRVTAVSDAWSDTATVRVLRDVRYTQVAAGANHTCALSTEGYAYCWGGNSYGQLGSPTSPAQARSTRVHGDLKFVTLASGGWHTCGMTSANELYCWGQGFLGQLGGALASSSVPRKIEGGPWMSVAVGSGHTCALSGTGAAFCWGNASEGRLGIGIVINGQAVTPLSVAGSHVFDRIASGYASHTCGSVADTLYCWGVNGSGRLGTGDSATAYAPRAVVGGLIFDHVAAGDAFTCALDQAGAAYCWGSNASGRLGIGTLAVGPPTPTAVTGGLTFAGIAVGAVHACAWTAAGETYCWGNATDGRLGTGIVVGSPSAFPMPSRVAGGITFTSVAVGADHSCALAPDGAVWCWGRNADRQVGVETGGSSAIPVRVGLSWP